MTEHCDEHSIRLLAYRAAGTRHASGGTAIDRGRRSVRRIDR
jgi:hypothetical protein